MMFKKKREQKTKDVRQEIIRGLQMLQNLKDSDSRYGVSTWDNSQQITTNIKVSHTEFGYTVDSAVCIDFDPGKGTIKALGEYSRAGGQSEEDSLELSIKDSAAAEKIVKFIAMRAADQDLIDPIEADAQ